MPMIYFEELDWRATSLEIPVCFQPADSRPTTQKIATTG